jgi:hypothetical protein
MRWIQYRSIFIKSADGGPRVVTSPQLSEDLVNCYRRYIKNGGWNKLAALAVAVGCTDLRETLEYWFSHPCKKKKIKNFWGVCGFKALCERVYE